jgi:flagellar motor switch protein FliM
VVKMVVQELNVAWQPVGLQLAFAKRETEAQVIRIMGASEKTLCVSFEVRMPEAQGVLNLCLPAAVLNAILRRLIAEGDRPRRRSREAQVRMLELIGEASVGAVLQFPTMRLRAREIAALMPGSILRLPLPHHADAELRINGLAIGRAHPVWSGEHRGAQLEIEGVCDEDVAEAAMSVN